MCAGVPGIVFPERKQPAWSQRGKNESDRSRSLRRRDMVEYAVAESQVQSIGLVVFVEQGEPGGWRAVNLPCLLYAAGRNVHSNQHAAIVQPEEVGCG